MKAAFAAMLIASMPAIASAQTPPCRAVVPADAAAMQEWTTLAGVGAIGACSDDGGTCFVVGSTWCTARADHEGEATGTILAVPGGTLLVVHWLYDHGGTLYWGGAATEVWRVDGAPTFLFSVVASYNEGIASDDADHDVDVCHVARAVQVDAAGVLLGRRTTRGSCHEVMVMLDRRGARPLPAAAAHWTWSQLGVAPAPITQ